MGIRQQTTVIYMRVLSSVLEQLLLNSRYRCKMSFAPATWMGATDHRPGTSFENPLVDYHAQRDLISEHYYVLDSVRHDIVRTTQGGLVDYIRPGARFAILNKSGLRVLLQNGRCTVQKLHVYAIDPAENTLLRLNDRSWEFISVKTALAQSASDDTIYHGKIMKSMSILDIC